MNTNARLPLLVVALSASASLGCGGGAASKAPATGATPNSATAAAAHPAAAPRVPSDVVRARWPFDDKASFALYGDVEGLLKTELFHGLVPALLQLGAAHMEPKEQACLKLVADDARELAVGSDTRGDLLIIRVAPGTAKDVAHACAALIADGHPQKVEGADDAYAGAQVGLLAAKDDVVVAGADPLVNAALKGGAAASTPWASDLSLGNDQYVAWRVKHAAEGFTGHGGLVESNEHFKFTADADVPNPKLAALVEQQLSSLKQAPAGAAAAGVDSGVAAALQHLAQSVDVHRDGTHLTLVFELREAPTDQARDLGMAASLAIASVTKYFAAAKEAEAHVTTRAIARAYLASWDGNAKKKLVSFPPVPKAVPKGGAPYQSTPADWKAWAPIHFELDLPQRYQYEVRAAKDGMSGDVIARGDLDGDGTPTELKVHLQVDKASHALTVAPDAATTNAGAE